MRKRLLEGLRPHLSLLLTAVIVLGLLPLSALAADQRPEVPGLSWEEHEDVMGQTFKEKPSAKTSYTAYKVDADGNVAAKEVTIDTKAELGTAANPIAITDEADLILFGQQAEDATTGKYYILEQEAYDMQGGTYTMIPLFPTTWSNSGMPMHSFQGTLIGDGAAIQNACIVGWGAETQSYYPGLFSGMAYGSLWDVTLKDAVIYADTGENEPGAMGGLVGFYGPAVDNMIQLAGCTVSADFVGVAQEVGGLVGTVDNWEKTVFRVADCHVSIAGDLQASNILGGLIGSVSSPFTAASCTVKVSGELSVNASETWDAMVGGLVGYVSPKTSTVNILKNEVELGAVKAVSSKASATAGGLIGALKANNIADGSNIRIDKNLVSVAGNITADGVSTSENDSVAGGLIGHNRFTSDGKANMTLNGNRVAVEGSISIPAEVSSRTGALIGHLDMKSSDGAFITVDDSTVAVTWPLIEDRQYARGILNAYPGGKYTLEGGSEAVLRIRDGEGQIVAVIHRPFGCSISKNQTGFLEIEGGNGVERNGLWVTPTTRVTAYLYPDSGALAYPGGSKLSLRPSGNAASSAVDLALPGVADSMVEVAIDSDSRLHVPAGAVLHPGTGNAVTLAHPGAVDGTGAIYYALTVAEGGTGVTESGLRKAGSTVTLAPGTREGYTFTGWTAGPNVTISGNGFTMPDSPVTVTANWKEAPPTLTGIAIAQRPNKTSYTVGEELDLTGLSVSLTYSNSHREEVTLADFEDKGVTATPPNGTKLTLSDTAVTVSAGGKSDSFPISVTQPEATVTGVTVAPATVTVQKGTTQTFTAIVSGTNSPSQDVTWNVADNQSSDTKFSGNVLTVAADETAQTLTVTATSDVDKTKSGAATVTVTADAPDPVYAISATPAVLDFGTLREGYGQPEAKTVTVTNIGNQEVTLSAPACTGMDYDLGALSNDTLAPQAAATFTVRPKAGLTAGTYNDTITIGVDQGQSAEFTVSFTVESDMPAVTYTLTFDSQGGSVVSPITGVTAGATVTLPTPTRSNYRFDGWFTAATGGTPFTSATPVTADLTLYAHWTYTGGGGNGGGSGGGGGGGSSSGTTTKTEKNEDGSTTKTVTDKKTGTVTETTKYPDGSQTVVETKKDGTVTTTKQDKAGNQTETVKQPDGAVTTTEQRTDGTKVVSKTDKDGATSATITVPKGLGAVTVTIPTQNEPGAGTVAVLVREDGTREVVMTSLPGKTGVTITLTQGASVEIVDNAKRFNDLPDTHWATDAVAFVTARELFTGTGDGVFASEQPMSRAMLFTVLARLDGADLTGGETWYEKAAAWAVENGVSDGQDPDGRITREQLVTMLWRYAGSPVSGRTLDSFNDAGQAGDFAVDALGWAVEQGVITGKDGGILDPKGDATRAEVAAMLQRFLVRKL